MFKRCNSDVRFSFAAFDDWKIVTFISNEIGDFRGLPTTYDTGINSLNWQLGYSNILFHTSRNRV